MTYEGNEPLQVLRWQADKDDTPTMHNLILRLPTGKERIVATVWDNGIWHTWDQDGVGGENDIEDTVARAKVEAAASAIAQGFV